ncbi:hypothetical protein, partial [Elizabethkingia meningoseptica]|uniref:hypothetical protein n=1 Tax=Elizabethkingia meningoseptica TaxID=238 RepID=UPI0031588D24
HGGALRIRFQANKRGSGKPPGEREHGFGLRTPYIEDALAGRGSEGGDKGLGAGCVLHQDGISPLETTPGNPSARTKE